MKIAVLGLGIMGGGIARNLIRKGFPTVVWNRTSARTEPFRALGADAAESPAAAAAGADVVIDVVSDVAASRETWTGPNGALAVMSEGAVAVECATLSAAWIRELAQTAHRRGVAFLDSPMTGSKTAAEQGTLILLVGADPADLEKARPVLEAFSAKIFLFGPPPSGTAYKLVNNLVAASQVVSMAGGLALAERAGLDAQTVEEAVQAGVLASPIVKNKLPFLLRKDFAETQFALKWMFKDVGYALELADELGIEMPEVAAVHRLFAQAAARGWGDLDYSAVAKLFIGPVRGGER
jgi:3-hydroxyisobutyrate dehydrogenase